MKNKLLTLLIGVSVTLALVAVPLMTACAPEVEVPEVPEVAPKTVNMGYMAPLTGPAAMWGIPPITGVKIWQTRVNDEGGLDIAGEKYLVNVVYYDDEMTGTKALIGAKKLVLEDDVQMMIVMSGPPAAAVSPFLSENRIISFTPAIYETMPTRPYMFSAGNNYPFTDSMILNYIVDTHPEVQRVAFACQDTRESYYALAIMKALAEVRGLDIVYETLFDTATTDFAPVMSAILATDPDLVVFGAIWGDFRATLVEQAYLQGVQPGEIQWHASEWLLATDLAKVPAAMLEGAVGAFPYCNDPFLPPQAMEFWDAWHARFGPGAPEDEHRGFTSADWYSFGYVNNWELGVEAAGTFEPDAVKAALLALPEPFHVYGALGWWGEELQGVSQTLAIRQQLTEVIAGDHVAVVEVDFFDWVEANIDAIVKWFTEYGLLWWQ